MRCLVQLAGSTAQGDRLADADLARDYAQQPLGDAKADASYGFLMAGPIAEFVRRDAFAKRCVSKAKVGDPGCTRHGCWSSRWSSRFEASSTCMFGKSRKASWPRVSASCAASTRPR
jgi:hypothetical protein